MTQSLDAEVDEPLSQRIARRLRGTMAENRITQTALAAAMHMPQQKLSRKVTGFTPFTLDEIELVASVLGVSLEAVQGIREYEDRGIGRCSLNDDDEGELRARRDSNSQPSDPEPNVISLESRRRPAAQPVIPTPIRRLVNQPLGRTS